MGERDQAHGAPPAVQEAAELDPRLPHGRLDPALFGAAGRDRTLSAPGTKTVLALQRTAGNRAVVRLVGAALHGRKLARETWWRGAGQGVLPSSPGGAVHDLGDGLYFTSEEALARQYATLRAGDKTTPQLFRIDLERSALGRVLDLTKDARWAEFMRRPAFPGGPTQRALIEMVNENYSSFFRAFLAEHKLNLADFDAVIGPEYVRGGTQVCIRNPALQAQIRSNMALVPWAGEAAAPGSAAAAGSAAEATAAGEAVARGRWASVAGRVAAVAVETVIFAIIVLALDYLRRKQEQRKFREKMKAAQPQIEAAITGQGEQIRALQRTSAGRTVWARITIWIDSQEAVTGGPMGMVAYDHSFADAGFASATVGLDYRNTRTQEIGKPMHLAHQYGTTTYTTRRESVTYSVPVPYDPAALPDLMARNKRISENEHDASRTDLPQSVLQALFDEREAFVRFGPRVYGPPAPRIYGPPAPEN
jgi:hypothetical protein